MIILVERARSNFQELMVTFVQFVELTGGYNGSKLEELKQLAEAVKRKNAADTEISRIILRPT